MTSIEIDAAMDETAIRKLLFRLAEAADNRDEPAYRACLASTVRKGAAGDNGPSVPAESYARASIALLSRADWTHHTLTTPVIDIEAGRQRASARVDVVVDIAFTDSGKKPHRLELGGRYDVGCVRRGGAWWIDRCTPLRLRLFGDIKAIDV